MHYGSNVSILLITHGMNKLDLQCMVIQLYKKYAIASYTYSLSSASLVL